MADERVPAAVAALRRHVDRFNAGVSSGDFSPMTAAMAPYCEMRFRGIAIGPYRGREAVEAAYREQPPDDRILLLSAAGDTHHATAEYAWFRVPARVAGRITVTLADDGLIEQTVIDYYPDPA